MLNQHKLDRQTTAELLETSTQKTTDAPQALHYVNDRVFESIKTKEVNSTTHPLEISGEIDILMELILAEDELDQQANELVVWEALQPLERLPIEDITAKLPANSTSTREQDFKIMIPLQVIDQTEVDQMIDLYNQQND